MTPESLHALVMHLPAFPRKQRRDSSIRIPLILTGQLDDPSLGTLLGRGRHFMIIWNRGCTSDDIFATSEGYANHAIYSFQDDALSDGATDTAGDSYLLSSYPGYYWDCGTFSKCDAQWDAAVAIGANLVKTNGFDEDWSFGDGTYCSVPLYVDPNYSGDDQWGTPRAPFTTFFDAIVRISEISPIPKRADPHEARAGRLQPFSVWRVDSSTAHHQSVLQGAGDVHGGLRRDRLGEIPCPCYDVEGVGGVTPRDDALLQTGLAPSYSIAPDSGTSSGGTPARASHSRYTRPIRNHFADRPVRNHLWGRCP